MKFEPGDVVASIKDGELWQLDIELESLDWGAFNETRDTILKSSEIRQATAAETAAFKPSRFVYGRRANSRTIGTVRAANGVL